MIKLLLVSPKTKQSKGGIAVWTDIFLSHCEQNGVDCDLLNIAMIGSRANQSNGKRDFMDEFTRTRKIFTDLKFMLQAKKYDVAHINTSCGTFGLIRDYITAYKIKKTQPQCKIVVQFHCDVKTQVKSSYKVFFLKKFFHLADKVLVLNENNKKYLFDTFGAVSDAVANFIDDSWLRDSRKQISDNIGKAVFVGHIQPQKGVSEIFELAKVFPQITFELIGEIRPDVQLWEKPQNVVFGGTKNRMEIIASLDAADIFVFPTHSEGFSLALLESMARGLPCVTTDVGANAEMIENKGGVIVSVGDVPGMILAIERLSDPQIRQEFSDWNVKKVRENYTADAVISGLIQLY